jgi:succinate dehydrogenase flavin-adding protein (antitoxin of CptAB toxin-antitoxin module)
MNLKSFFLSLFIFLFSISLIGQELKCKVNVNALKLTTTNKERFEKLKTDVEDFLNLTQWTQHQFTENEKIVCNVSIVLDNETAANQFNGTISIQSSRPVYKTAYQTTLINILDKQFSIKYDEFEVLEYNENQYRSNLTSILAFYAYIIIGMDYDSFELNSGDQYFEKAQEIVYNAQSDPDVDGWKSKDGNVSRYWLVDNLLNANYSSMRSMYYNLHMGVLDLMHNNKEGALKQLSKSIKELEAKANLGANTYMYKHFFQCKNEELYNLLMELQPAEQRELKSILLKLSPVNADKWNKLGIEEKKQQQGRNNKGFDPRDPSKQIDLPQNAPVRSR